MHKDPESAPQSPNAPIVALTGFMGAGKTSVGHALAELLGWAFVDVDHAIEMQQKLRVGEIFQRHGEARFREIETEALRALLAQAAAPTIIALGGGTFAQPCNAELLRSRNSRVVFLAAPVELLLKRCHVGEQLAHDNPRPLAADPDLFRMLYQQRLPSYLKANVTVLTEGRSVDQVAREIAAGLGLAVLAG